MRIVFTILIIFCACSLWAQNLIPNGSFEEVENCYTIFENQVPGWYNPIITSPDIYFSNTSCLNEYAIDPQDGNNYSGFACGIPDLSSFDPREYLSVKLLSTLEANKVYKLSFWIRESPYTGFTSDKIGIYFSEDSVVQTSEDLFNITPHLQTPDNLLFIGGDWIEYVDYYEAQGGEQFMTIGGFVPSSELIFHYHFTGSSSAGAYYDFDNFILKEVEGENVEEINQSVSLYPNPTSEILNIQSALPVESIQITSLGGLVVIQEQITNNYIDVGSIPCGIYIAEVHSSDGQIHRHKLNISR